MKSYTESLHEELLIRLQELDKSYDPQNLPDHRLQIITETVDQIKEKLKTHQFPCEEEEIQYFKSVLPPTLSLYIYYADRIEWDRIRFLGSPESKYAFTDRVYSRAEHFRSLHKDFYEYVRDGKTFLDRFYFLRDSPGNQESVYPLRSIIDRNSPTIYCEMKARLLAYTRLEQELHRAVTESKDAPPITDSDKPTLIWTLSKVNLTELVYALYATGAFNYGKVELSDIQKCFEKTFGIVLGNISRSFQEILARKKGHTSFLDQLKIFLMKKITGLDEKNLKNNMD